MSALFHDAQETRRCCLPKRLVLSKLRRGGAVIFQLDRNGVGLHHTTLALSKKLDADSQLTESTASNVPST
jgi:hypothetical protein